MREPLEQYKSIDKLELGNIEKELPQKFKKIICPSCNVETSATNINLQNSIAKCSNCNVIFSIEEEMEKVKTKNELRQEIIRPEGIDLFYYRDDLDITVDQHIQGFDAWAIAFAPLIAVAAILNYFIAEQPISVYFPIIFSLLAFYFVYIGINYSKNKSYIEINGGNLSIRHRPAKFKKDRVYAAKDIDQLFIKPTSDGVGHYFIYMVINEPEEQIHEKLLKVNSLSKAKFLEQEIEKHLKIVDREIPEAKF